MSASKSPTFALLCFRAIAKFTAVVDFNSPFAELTRMIFLIPVWVLLLIVRRLTFCTTDTLSPVSLGGLFFTHCV